MAILDIPEILLATQKFAPILHLPINSEIQLDSDLPTFIYNYYNLDPLWHRDERGNRVLLLEPIFFNTYPVSKKCIDFMLALANNIAGIQVFVGSFEDLVKKHQLNKIYYKEHPLNIGYKGIEEQRDWMAKNVSGYFSSFFGYWRQAEKYFKN